MLVFHLLQKPYERKCSDTFVSHCLPLLFQFILSHCTVALFFFFTLYTFNCVFVTCVCTHVSIRCHDHTLSLTAFLYDFSSQYLCSDIIYRMLILRSCSFYPYVLPNCTRCTIVLIVKFADFFVISIRVFNSG